MVSNKKLTAKPAIATVPSTLKKMSAVAKWTAVKKRTQ
jgi:hypothetical protein